MGETYTRLSQMAFEKAYSAEVDAEEVLEMLLHDVPVRSFADVIARYAPKEQAQELLCKGLMKNDPSRKPDSVARNVRDWMRGARVPKERDSLWELCFLLDLSLPQADELLAMLGETGVHWRDPREMTYAYALKQGMTYPEATALQARVAAELETASGEEERKAFTSLAKETFRDGINSESELKAFLRENASQLGQLHNTAWGRFNAYLKALESPDEELEMEDESYTLRNVLATYFYNHLPSAREGKQLSWVHQTILKDWPTEVDFSRIRNGVTDVPRKVLMLLFLMTDGIVDEENDERLFGSEAYDEWLSDEEDGDLEFCSSYERMNTMLADCGYRMLDPRNAFDWLMIYCMREETDDEFGNDAGESLRQVLSVMFPYDGDED